MRLKTLGQGNKNSKQRRGNARAKGRHPAGKVKGPRKTSPQGTPNRRRLDKNRLVRRDPDVRQVEGEKKGKPFIQSAKASIGNASGGGRGRWARARGIPQKTRMVGELGCRHPHGDIARRKKP